MRYVSPTGSPIVGTLEQLSAVALVTEISPSGVPTYGSGTDVWWDSQKSVLHNGKLVFVDDDGAEWPFDRLSPAPEEGEDAG